MAIIDPLPSKIDQSTRLPGFKNKLVGLCSYHKINLEAVGWILSKFINGRLELVKVLLG